MKVFFVQTGRLFTSLYFQFVSCVTMTTALAHTHMHDLQV